MTILHYTLGLYPYRSGGLTKYATDLMIEQSKHNIVYCIYPSGYSMFSNRITWKLETNKNEIRTIKIQNSYPIPLLFGVKNAHIFTTKKRMHLDVMEELYNQIKPDVLHVHSLMGLPKELLAFLKSKGVKLIYTSHDYYGICLKVNLINHNGELCKHPSPYNCKICNRSSKSTLFLRLYNSRLALWLKTKPIIKHTFK